MNKLKLILMLIVFQFSAAAFAKATGATTAGNGIDIGTDGIYVACLYEGLVGVAPIDSSQLYKNDKIVRDFNRNAEFITVSGTPKIFQGYSPRLLESQRPKLQLPENCIMFEVRRQSLVHGDENVQAIKLFDYR